jgi:hypothetical protein
VIEQLPRAEGLVLATRLGLLLEGLRQCSSLRSSQHFSTLSPSACAFSTFRTYGLHLSARPALRASLVSFSAF